MVETSEWQHVALNQSKIAADIRVNVLRENGGVTHRVHTVLVDVRERLVKYTYLIFAVVDSVFTSYLVALTRPS